jgi:ABC-type amino acid transport substrate-binding protein
MTRNNILILAILAAALASGYLLFKLSPSNQYQHNAHELVVGTAAGYAPFVSINADGQYEGFDIDIAHALAQQMGKTLVLKDLGSMAPLFTALDQGTIDCIIWGLTITANRLQKVAMVHYQGATTSSYPLMFWNSIPTNVQSITDMKGKTICVEPHSAQENFLHTYPDVIILPTEKVDDALLNIQYGKADGALVEWAIAKKFTTKYPEIQILPLPLTPQQQEHGVGIVVKPINSALIAEIQTAVDTLKSTGVIATLETKWSIAP